MKEEENASLNGEEALFNKHLICENIGQGRKSEIENDIVNRQVPSYLHEKNVRI